MGLSSFTSPVRSGQSGDLRQYCLGQPSAFSDRILDPPGRSTRFCLLEKACDLACPAQNSLALQIAIVFETPGCQNQAPSVAWASKLMALSLDHNRLSVWVIKELHRRKLSSY